MKTKILFLGGSSLLAFNWCKHLGDDSEVYLGVHNKIPELRNYANIKFDFDLENNLERKISSLNLDVIINCVGYTNVENCEINPNKARKVNTELPLLIAEISNKLKIKLVHISTDHLFDGKTNYNNEKSEPKPLNNYAKSKLDGENKVLKVNKDALIIRTNFFGWGPTYKKSFSDFIISSLENNLSISLFSDVDYNPILVSELANAVKKLLNKNSKGIYNVVSPESISKLKFGYLLAKEFNLNKNLIQSTKLINRKELVKRPLDMTLSTKKLNDEGIFIKNLKEQIRDLKEQRSNSINKFKNPKIIPYGRQNISEEDIKSVVKVLKSDYLTQGPVSVNFEKAIANYTNSNFGVSVSSATAALHISCLALGLKKDDIVWTSPITFVASANCAIYCGAKVDFVDIDSKTYNISINALSKKLEIARVQNKLPKILIPVHLSGQSCDMSEIYKLSKKYKFKIIEDASHAIGGKYNGEPIGNCKYSNITVFSFHPVKIITTGEGGMCTTNDPEIANKLCRYRSHGITRHESEMTKKSDGPWYYQQIELGFNYRMTDINAALGLSQLNSLDEFISKRHAIALKYDLAFADKPLIIPYQHQDNYSSYHLYIIRIKNTTDGLNKLNLFNNLRELGILVNLHYIPVYQQPFYHEIGYNSEDYPESEKYYEEALSLPIHTLLTVGEQDFVIENVLNFLSRQKTFINNHKNKDLDGYQTIF
ncbi:UDP-4-amino-4,6-dideoxy-N-acetyl-beta-L-altrosamine transaminase [Flavobacteriaceae bacterium]|jgi:UDP-4-amino-4,6-dideoxy-N-acetyl-beta-L-altrosamine transaminase/dTDP-4-dehydrorhamnose reductase|nr:UDP-4-amino-4,6-dideoxy-N-acetyl-beta-L-altrosamine transaminase [Flavobacteriaceae bacterium]